MDGKCTDLHISMVAKFLPEWKAVASQLGLERQQAADIVDQYHDAEEQRYEALTRWVRREGSQATYRKIYDALCDMGEMEAAEKVAEITRGQIYGGINHSRVS